MEASDIFKCIADTQRLRILNLLEVGPLCVCHLQDLLDAKQVKISKQLAGMKQLGLVDSKREGTWMIYHLNTPLNGLLQSNIDYLRQADCADCNQLQQDLKARKALVQQLTKNPFDCPEPVCESIGCC